MGGMDQLYAYPGAMSQPPNYSGHYGMGQQAWLRPPSLPAEYMKSPLAASDYMKSAVADYSEYSDKYQVGLELGMAWRFI